MKNLERSAILGVLVGDALGVPVEFKSRSELEDNPVTTMRGFGTYNQPEGTWSDDGSLTLCLVAELAKGYDLEGIGQSFVRWRYEKEWTPWGEVFDIGITTSYALQRIRVGISAAQSGEIEEDTNGNGSLMRIMPLLFFIKNKPLEERFELTRQVSSITHAHIRSVLACFYYLEFATFLLNGMDKHNAYKATNELVSNFMQAKKFDNQEFEAFKRILEGKIPDLQRHEIKGNGYVVNALEASLWCFLGSATYSEAVLKAVNLGDDTDTTAAITGGLAGLYFGEGDIPNQWISKLARINDIENVINEFKQAML